MGDTENKAVSPINPLQVLPTIAPPVLRSTTMRPYVTTTLGSLLTQMRSKPKFSISRSFHLDPTEAIDSPFRYRF